MRAQAPEAKGLDALDRERAASVADEGGTAAAKVEDQERERAESRRPPGASEFPEFDDSGETPAMPVRLRGSVKSQP